MAVLIAVQEILDATNWYAVVTAAITVQFMNFILYAFVWSEAWMRAVYPGKYRKWKEGGTAQQEVEQEMAEDMPVAFTTSLVSVFVVSFASFHLQHALGVDSTCAATQLSLFMALLIYVPNYLGGVAANFHVPANEAFQIWEDPDNTLMIINVADQVLSHVVMGIVLFMVNGSDSVVVQAAVETAAEVVGEAAAEIL